MYGLCSAEKINCYNNVTTCGWSEVDCLSNKLISGLIFPWGKYLISKIIVSNVRCICYLLHDYSEFWILVSWGSCSITKSNGMQANPCLEMDQFTFLYSCQSEPKIKSIVHSCLKVFRSHKMEMINIHIQLWTKIDHLDHSLNNWISVVSKKTRMFWCSLEWF